MFLRKSKRSVFIKLSPCRQNILRSNPMFETWSNYACAGSHFLNVTRNLLTNFVLWETKTFLQRPNIDRNWNLHWDIPKQIKLTDDVVNWSSNFLSRSFPFCKLQTSWDVMRRKTKESSVYNNIDDSNKLHYSLLIYSNNKKIVTTLTIDNWKNKILNHDGVF